MTLFGGGSEKGIFDRSTQILKYTSEANRLLGKVIKGSDNIEPLRKVEHASDKEVFELTSAITSGGIAPNLIDDMIQLINIEDQIVDDIFNLGRSLARYKCPEKKMDMHLRKQMLGINELVDASINVLIQMHKTDTLASLKTYRVEIEELEEAGDDIKDDTIAFAYRSKMDFKSFYHMVDATYLADDILDGCEDAADMYLSIMLSILT